MKLTPVTIARLAAAVLASIVAVPMANAQTLADIVVSHFGRMAQQPTKAEITACYADADRLLQKANEDFEKAYKEAKDDATREKLRNTEADLERAAAAKRNECDSLVANSAAYFDTLSQLCYAYLLSTGLHKPLTTDAQRSAFDICRHVSIEGP